MQSFKNYVTEELLIEALTPQELHDGFYKDIPMEIFTKIVQADPTTLNDRVGTYSKWLLNLYKKDKNVASDEELADSYVFLKAYDKAKTAGKIDRKDINSFKSVDELYTYLESKGAADPSEVISKRGAEKKIKADAEKVFEDDKWTIIVPKTHAASCFYGASAKWCTTSRDSDHHFKQYSSQGPLYILISKKDPNVKFQFHFPSKQFANVRNDMDSYEDRMENDIQDPKVEEFFDEAQGRYVSSLGKLFKKHGGYLKAIQDADVFKHVVDTIKNIDPHAKPGKNDEQYIINFGRSKATSLSELLGFDGIAFGDAIDSMDDYAEGEMPDVDNEEAADFLIGQTPSERYQFLPGLDKLMFGVEYRHDLFDEPIEKAGEADYDDDDYKDFLTDVWDGKFPDYDLDYLKDAAVSAVTDGYRANYDSERHDNIESALEDAKSEFENISGLRIVGVNDRYSFMLDLSKASSQKILEEMSTAAADDVDYDPTQHTTDSNISNDWHAYIEDKGLNRRDTFEANSRYGGEYDEYYAKESFHDLFEKPVYDKQINKMIRALHTSPGQTEMPFMSGESYKSIRSFKDYITEELEHGIKKAVIK